MYHLQLYIYIYLYMNFGTWNGRPAACAGRPASLRERHAASLGMRQRHADEKKKAQGQNSQIMSQIHVFLG
jgi:hypothetical protein